MSEAKHTQGPMYAIGTDGEPDAGITGYGVLAFPPGDDEGTLVADGCSKADATLFAAAPDLLAYAMLEAEYTRQCDRTRPDYSPTEFREWVEKHISGNEPIGRWLGRIRDAAIRKAIQGA